MWFCIKLTQVLKVVIGLASLCEKQERGNADTGSPNKRIPKPRRTKDEIRDRKVKENEQ
jgi:hypothetical protein